jgi:predicted phage-related endonuclease
MSQNEMITKIEALREWESLLDEASKEVEALKDQLKNEMNAQGKEELTAGKYILRWTSVLSTRFDSTAFKREHSDLYKAFTKQTASRRFSISA